MTGLRLQPSALLALVTFGAALPALSGIQYTCDPTFLTYAPANTCAANMNGPQAAGVYSSIFSNVNASIYITFGATGVGQSSANFTGVSYSNYYNALVAHGDTAGLASLPSIDPLNAAPYGSDDLIDVSAALANALGLTQNGANTAGVMADGVTNCTLGDPGCYNGVITVTDNGGAGGAFYFPASPTDPGQLGLIDFYSVVEHETDEILGTISCIGGSGFDMCNPGGTDASAADLFRYSAAGVRTFLNASDGTTGAYFSLDGGATVIANYNNSPIGGDYGDWIPVGQLMVQDALASPDATLDISTDTGVGGYPQPEVAVLNAVGFTLNSQATPEPRTFALLAAGLMTIVLVSTRTRRRELAKNRVKNP